MHLQANIVSILKEQARMAFTCDGARVKESIVPSHQQPYPTLSAAFENLRQQITSRPNQHPNLQSCLMFVDWLNARAQNPAFLHPIDEALAAVGYTDFQFIDHGGRALAFRTHHKHTGHQHILRIEAPHSHRMHRPHHPTILPAFYTWGENGNNDGFHNIKIEICREVLPLSKLPLRKDYLHTQDLVNIFHRALHAVSWGTNMTYPIGLFDHDADPHNVGVLPNGHIVAFDPEIITGADAMRAHHHFKDPLMLRDASLWQLRNLYGQPPEQRKVHPS